MESGRLFNKTLTTTTAVGTEDAASPMKKVVMQRSVPTATSNNLEYAGEDDSATVLSGVGDGDYATSPGSTPQRWGHVTSSGSRIEINDSDGGERIELIHRSGAGVSIDPDGGVYVTTESARGGGISAPKGDFYVNAQGDLVIKGAGSVTIDTAGDLNINVGGTLTISAGSYKLITQNQDETIDGAASRSVTNDQSVVIGGIDRKTVAGDSREQITGTKITDVGGKSNLRVDGEHTIDVGGKSTTKVNGDQSISTGGNHEQRVGGTAKYHSGGDVEVASGGDAVVSGGGNASVASGGATSLFGGSVHSSPPIDRAIHSNQTTNASFAQSEGGVVGPIPPLQSGGTVSASGPEGADESQVADANDVVDTLTSARKFPEYPGNGVTESANKTGYSMISYDTTPQSEDVFNEYSGGNMGNVNPSYQGGSYDNLPPAPVNRSSNIRVVESSTPVPARHNNNAKISKYFTLGQLVNAKHSHKIPVDQWESVVAAHIKVATNVLDAVKEKFPDLEITSAYRNNSNNHRTGLAIDMVVHSRDMTKHAEIARFARDNLAVDQVFIEKNTSGRTHVHLRCGSGSPRVLTCGDPQCNSSTPGIQVAWLARRAV